MSRKLNSPRRKLPKFLRTKTTRLLREAHAGEAGYFLHPTKGWKKKSAKTSIAENITAEMKKGLPWKFKQIQQLLKNAG